MDERDKGGYLDMQIDIQTAHYYHRTIQKYCVKDFEGAIIDFDKALTLQPDYKLAKSFMKICIIRIFENR